MEYAVYVCGNHEVCFSTESECSVCKLQSRIEELEKALVRSKGTEEARTRASPSSN